MHSAKWVFNEKEACALNETDRLMEFPQFWQTVKKHHQYTLESTKNSSMNSSLIAKKKTPNRNELSLSGEAHRLHCSKHSRINKSTREKKSKRSLNIFLWIYYAWKRWYVILLCTLLLRMHNWRPCCGVCLFFLLFHVSQWVCIKLCTFFSLSTHNFFRRLFVYTLMF